jgi:hypothetical protein
VYSIRIYPIQLLMSLSRLAAMATTLPHNDLDTVGGSSGWFSANIGPDIASCASASHMEAGTRSMEMFGNREALDLLSL